MALVEYSRYWDTETAPLSSHSVPISEEEWVNFHFAALARNISNAGILSGVPDDDDTGLEVSIAYQTIHVKAGYAIARGFVYWVPVDGTLDVTIPIPPESEGSTGHRVVLRVNWNTKTVRVILHPDFEMGTATLPALVQDFGDIWDIPLWSGVIDTSGAVSGGVDERVFVHYATRVKETMVDTGAISTRAIEDDAVTGDKAGEQVVVADGRVGFGPIENASWSAVGGSTEGFPITHNRIRPLMFRVSIPSGDISVQVQIEIPPPYDVWGTKPIGWAHAYVPAGLVLTGDDDPPSASILYDDLGDEGTITVCVKRAKSADTSGGQTVPVSIILWGAEDGAL